MNSAYKYSLLRIYKDYCTHNSLQPNVEILALLENQRNELVLSNPYFLDEKDFFGLSLVISQNPEHLQELSISDQNLESTALSMFSSSLKNNAHLKKLALINCLIDDQGALALGLTLAENKTLREFDISGNKITSEGVESIADGIKENESLEILSVAKNLIDVDFFGEALKKNKTLAKLDISYNSYQIESIQALFSGLPANKSLRSLEMVGIPIAQINVHRFCEVMHENSTLEHIHWDLEINDHDLDLFDKLEKMALMNFSLRGIHTSKTEISLQNRLGSLLFLYLESNQWIHENIKNINNSGIPPCPNYLLPVLKEKLNFLQNNEENPDPNASMIQEVQDSELFSHIEESHEKREEVEPEPDSQIPRIEEYASKQTVNEEYLYESEPPMKERNLAVGSEKASELQQNTSRSRCFKRDRSEEESDFFAEMERRIEGKITERMEDKWKGVAEILGDNEKKITLLERKLLSFEETTTKELFNFRKRLDSFELALKKNCDKTDRFEAFELQIGKLTKDLNTLTNSTQILKNSEIFSREISLLKEKLNGIEAQLECLGLPEHRPERRNSTTIETLKSILSNNKLNKNAYYAEDKPIKDGPEVHFGGKDGQSELEKYVKSNFAEIFEKISELNKMATHLVKQHEKYNIPDFEVFIKDKVDTYLESLASRRGETDKTPLKSTSFFSGRDGIASER